MAAASVALLASAAQAADLPYEQPAAEIAVAPTFSWTGAYVGAQGGYSWGDVGGAKPKGFMLGGFAGYNFQLDNSPLVFGVETDLNWSDADVRSGGAKFDSRWNGATRGRIGFAFDRFMVYGAAGVAYADTRLRFFGSKDSKTTIGWTAGGGVEAAVSDNITVRADYRYADYGSESYSLAGGRARVSYDEHRVMGGVAYKFSW
jgi:outer membrane immunogenic protein